MYSILSVRPIISQLDVFFFFFCSVINSEVQIPVICLRLQDAVAAAASLAAATAAQ